MNVSANIQVDYIRPKLYPKQLAAIFNPKDAAGNLARIAAIEASTKAGKTAGCMAWLAEQAIKFGREGRNYWWVAPSYGQARIAYSRFKIAIDRVYWSGNDSDMTLTLFNGSKMWFKSGEKPDNLYGEDVFACVIDEASRCRPEAWYAIRSTLTATRAPVRLIGNVKGRKNWFYTICRKAEAGEPNYSYAKITAYDAAAAGVIDIEEIEEAKRDLPEQVFRELYLAEPSDDGGNPFGLQHITACVRPLSTDRPFCFGVDLAKSQDWTVVIALDKTGVCCGVERWQGPWNVTEARLLDLLKMAPSYVDSTGVGDPIVERLQAKIPHVSGFHFSAKSKQQLMEGLAVQIQAHRIGFPDGVVRSELEIFEYEHTRTGVRYTAPEGSHDDCVMALALASAKYRELQPDLNGVEPRENLRISPWLGTRG